MTCQCDLGYITTNNLRMTRARTLTIPWTVRKNGQVVDLTGAKVFMWVRADLKIATAQVMLASETTVGHRVGIVIADQTGSDRGNFTITLIPADTETLVAAGADDPYFYDVWIVKDSEEYPVIDMSTLDLYPQATTVP